MEDSNMLSLEEKVKNILTNYPTILFMKGEKEMPACGFSAGVVGILNDMEIEFEAINILANSDLRGFMKKYSDWPTFPQLYHKSKLIGGYDIVLELYHKNQLKEIFK